MTKGGVATSASMKPLPNRHLQAFVQALPDGLDGEIIHPDGFHAADSFCMSKYKEPGRERYVVFDNYHPGLLFDRLEHLTWLVKNLKYEGLALALTIAPSTTCHYVSAAEYHVGQLLAEGYEGVIIRAANSLYRCGRSTSLTQELCAIKPFEDTEAIITGYLPLRKNLNVPTINELGLQTRSHEKAGRFAVSMLGALTVHHDRFGGFKIGSGFTEAERLDLWQRRETLVGKVVTFKYQLFGSKDKPRIPIYKAFRSPLDLEMPETSGETQTRTNVYEQ